MKFKALAFCGVLLGSSMAYGANFYATCTAVGEENTLISECFKVRAKNSFKAGDKIGEKCKAWSNHPHVLRYEYFNNGYALANSQEACQYELKHEKSSEALGRQQNFRGVIEVEGLSAGLYSSSPYDNPPPKSIRCLQLPEPQVFQNKTVKHKEYSYALAINSCQRNLLTYMGLELVKKVPKEVKFQNVAMGNTSFGSNAFYRHDKNKIVIEGLLNADQMGIASVLGLTEQETEGIDYLPLYINLSDELRIVCDSVAKRFSTIRELKERYYMHFDDRELWSQKGARAFEKARQLSFDRGTRQACINADPDSKLSQLMSR